MNKTLNKLANSPEVKLVNGLTDSIQAAKDELVRKNNIPNHEIRQKLLDVFGKIFDSGKPKLTFAAMEGLQTILRDSTFYSDKDGCRVVDSLSAQVLRCLNPVPTWSPQIQCQIFTILVQLISSNEFQISMADVFGAIQICFKAYLSSEDSGVKLAIRAALTQMLNSFCLNRQLRAAETNVQEEVAMLMDMTTLLNEVLPRLDCAASEKNTPDELQLALDAMYSITSVLPPFFYRHAPLLNLFKTEIIPALICLLQVCDDGESSTATKSKLAIVKQLNFRGANGTSNAKSAGRPNVFASPEVARSFYQVVEQVLQLFSGRKDEAKLILELYRTSILVLPSTKRLEALKLIKRVIFIADFCNITIDFLMVLTPTRLTIFLTNLRDEPLYWLIPMECLEECSKCLNPEICVEALNCLNALFTAFSGFLTKMDLSKFSDEFLQKIDEEFIERKDSNHSIQFLKKCDSREFIQAALNFVEKFRGHFLEWAALDNPKLIDDKILQFSIDISKENLAVNETINFNANAIYLTTYAALDLCVRIRYHQQSDEFENWVAKILTSGTNLNELCVDKEWLLQVYQLLMGENIFENVANCCALEQLVDDYDGFANGSLLAEQDGEETLNDESEKYVDESKRKVEKWIQNILASCWSSVLVILTRFSLKDNKKAILMSTSPSTNAIGAVISPASSSNSAAGGEKMLIEGTKATLECMRSLLVLLIRFSMHKEMSWIYEKLGEEICQLEDLRQLTSTLSQSGVTTLKKPWLLLNRNDAFAIAMMMENAIQHTTLPNGVWKYVVRSIEYITELERYLFQIRKEQVYDSNTCASGNESCEMVLELPHNELSANEVSKVLDELLLKIDIFFENAPKKLNLSSICTLLTTLIATNEDNLKYSGDMSTAIFSRITSCVLLQRISQLVCGVQNRNFIHRIKAWNCVKDNFTEAAFAKFPDDVTKMSICCIHDCLKALLIDENVDEKWRFNFNGTLFNIFQTILCSDVAKVETQEHIVSILGTFIEENGDQIGTGWKPLFGTLKAVHVSGNKFAVVRRLASDSLDDPSSLTDKQMTLKLSPVNAAVLDVFKKFLKLKNDEVIYLALLDYIHCVTNYLRSISSFSLSRDVKKTEDELEMDKFTQKTISLAVCSFLQDVQEFLFRIFEDPSNIPVNSALLNSLKTVEEQKSIVKNNFCEDRLKFLPDLSRTLCESYGLGLLPSQLNDLQKFVPDPKSPWHGAADSQKCILALFLSLIEDLCGLLAWNSSQEIHSRIVTTLADLILRFKSSKIGVGFGVFSLCENIFTCFRCWLQKSPQYFIPVGRLSSETRNLKQSAGIFTQVVVDYIVEFSAELWCEKLLNDVLELFNEFISHSSQFISGIGCSCLKHLLFSAKSQFSPQMWSRIALNIWKTICFTVFPVRALIAQFFANSKEFCGDMGEMSLKLKEAFGQTDYSELRAMAKQVFLITQRNTDIKCVNKSNINSTSEEKPSTQFAYVFVFNGTSGEDLTGNSEKLSFALDELITSLFNHQTIIQIISQLITGETNALLTTGTLSDESNICVSQNAEKGLCSGMDVFNTATEEGRTTIAALLFCVQASASIAQQFDERPALKFLLQKLCHLEEFGGGGETSINLHKVLVACQGVEMWALFRLSVTSFCGVSEEVYWLAFDTLIEDVFANLEKAEKSAATYKLAVFAREKFCKPVEYALAECQSPDESVKTFKVVKNTDYLKEYHRQKMVETLPKLPHSETVSSENKEGSTIVNPFLHAQPSSIPKASIGACDVDNSTTTDEAPHYDDLELSKFNNLDICILAHTEIIATFIEKISCYTDSQTFKKVLPKIFPKIQRFLLLTGNSRARGAITKFLSRIQLEMLESN